MNKELLSFLSIFIVLFIGAVYYTNTIQIPFISSLNYIKTTYHSGINIAQNSINKYFFQASEITRLTTELQKYENNHLVMQELASEVNDLFQANKSSLKSEPEVDLVRAISYKDFGDLNKVWIDVNDYNATQIYGLTYKEVVAGIVIPKNGRALALLNRDEKSVFAVHLGAKLAPGIAQGTNGEHLLVNYIPAWFKINIGDEVITSGIDNIFFKGLKVGKVISISKSNGFQSALISPYYKANDPNYFHIIRRQRWSILLYIFY